MSGCRKTEAGRRWLRWKRLTGMVLMLGVDVVDYVVSVPFSRHPWEAASAWCSRVARRFIRVFGIELEVEGEIPEKGMVVANHLSYWDIVVLSAVDHFRFISKAEVKKWPVFGWVAMGSKTLFVNRESKGDLVRVSDEVKRALGRGDRLVLFAEGTSSDGREVLPFRSSLLAPACEAEAVVTGCALRYDLPGGSVADEVCYWGDMDFSEHLWHFLGCENVRCVVKFGRSHEGEGNRRVLCKQLQAEVEALYGVEEEELEASGRGEGSRGDEAEVLVEA